MAELQGSAAKMAFKKALLWGTAILLGDGDQVEYASEDVVPTVALIQSDQITGQALPGASDLGAILVAGSISGMDFKYGGHENWIEQVFGGIGVTTVADGTGSKHKFDFGQSNQGFFGTLATEKVVSGPHEVDSFKPMSLVLTATAGQFVKATVTGIGRQLRKNDDDPPVPPGRLNDDSTLWTLPGLGAAPMTQRKVRFGQVKIRVGIVGDVLHDLCVTGMILSFVRNTAPVQTTCDGDYSSEPSTDTTTITGNFDFSIYNSENDFLVDAQLNKAVLTAVYTFLSPDEYDVGKPYKHVCYIPAFQLNDGWPSVGGLGKVPLAMTWTAHNAEIPVDVDATMPRWYTYNDIADIHDYGNA